MVDEMIGLLTLQVLREAGCSLRYLQPHGPDDTQLALAKELGATRRGEWQDSGVPAASFPASRPAPDRCRISKPSAALQPSPSQSIASRRSTVVLIGNVTPKVEIPLQAVVDRELRLQGTAPLRENTLNVSSFSAAVRFE